MKTPTRIVRVQVAISHADKLTHAPQLQAAYLRIEAHRRAVRRLELIWGTLAIAFPLVLTLIAAYIIWLENFW